jgi:hypothetical protein
MYAELRCVYLRVKVSFVKLWEQFSHDCGSATLCSTYSHVCVLARMGGGGTSFATCTSRTLPRVLEGQVCCLVPVITSKQIYASEGHIVSVSNHY